MFRRSLALIVFAVAAFSIYAGPVHAQITTGLTVELSNSNPNPGETLDATVKSFSYDISAAKITWYINGQIVSSNTGADILTFTAPAMGKQLTMRVVVAVPSGPTLSKSITLGSGSVDLIVETDGYVPPYFAGKVPPVHQNQIRFVAIPHLANSSGVEFDAKNLVYNWRKDNSPISSASGYGKQTLTLEGDVIPRPYDILVTVSAPGLGAQAQSLIHVETVTPFVQFYIDDPLYGPLFNTAISDTLRIGSQKEASVIAVPYGFNKPATSAGTLDLTWTVNNTEHSELANHENVVLRSPDNGSGISNVQLDIRNSKRILQGASGAFSVVFGGKAATTIMNTSKATF